MKLGMYNMAPEPISAAYLINPSHQSVCLYLYPHIIIRQRLGKYFLAVTNKRNNRGIVGRVVFDAVRVVSKEGRLLVLPRTSRFCYGSFSFFLCVLFILRHVRLYTAEW
jgi:hypothetical protein